MQAFVVSMSQYAVTERAAESGAFTIRSLLHDEALSGFHAHGRTIAV